MAIILDLVIIGIIALSTFLGYKQGLIKVAFKIVSFFIAIVITLILYKPVTNLIINNTTWDENIENTIYEKLSTTKVEQGEPITKEDTDLPGIVVNYINDGITNTVEQAGENIAKSISKDLTQSIIQVIVLVVLFIVTRILLIFAKVKQCNEMGGIIYGILRAAIIIFGVLALASFILPMINQMAILEYINNSILTKFLYNHNIILMLFF